MYFFCCNTFIVLLVTSLKDALCFESCILPAAAPERYRWDVKLHRVQGTPGAQGACSLATHVKSDDGYAI